MHDVHAHLTHTAFDEDRDAVIDRARRAGVTTILANGLNPADNEAVRELAAAVPEVRPCFGFYPVDAVLTEMIAMGVDYPRDGDPPWTAEEAVAWVADHRDQAVAIGEIGLDGHWVPEALWDRQESVFRQLLRLAREADLPVIIHTRKREKRALEVLLEEGITRVDWHCYGSRVKLARRIAEHGHHLSIPCNVRRDDGFRRMVETLPRDRILLETDCPYLGPERGARNEPANVAGTVAFMAESWGWTEGQVREQLADNFRALFRIDPG
jgi:TatD DNase family protein